MKNQILSVRLSVDERNDQRGDEPTVPDVILIRNQYPDAAALHRVLDYVCRSGMIGGYAVDPVYAFREFMLVKSAYQNIDGRQLLHFIVSFSTTEAYRLSADDMLALGYDICHLFPGHQVVYALHMDSAHCHLHFVVNSVSFEDGKKHFSGFHDLFPVRDFLQECFPRSNVHIYQSFPDSDVNRFGCSDDDELLRID